MLIGLVACTAFVLSRLMALIMLGVVLLFLYLGGLLHLFARSQGMSETGDRLFPAVVMQHLPAAMQLVFILALISALFRALMARSPR